LYFSCKNYKELAQARTTKVVGYFTMNRTNLVLHFSDFSVIFYAIYKNQPKGFTISVDLLQQGPYKESEFRNVVPGRPGSGGSAKFRPTAGRGRPGAGGG
jgi:hypothetical protein